MNIIKYMQDRIRGKLTVLTITDTSVKICHGRRSLIYELPKTFRGYDYLYHTEEMAGWLMAVLREEKIRIRRCRIVLDTEQVFLQTVKLPAMTAKEQQNWIRWEGNRYVPFEPGTYEAVLLPCSEPVGINGFQDTETTGVSGFSEEWQATEEAQLMDFLLAAVPRETIGALQQFGVFFEVQLTEVTALGPNQTILPVNLLPLVPGKEVMLRWAYKAGTVLCLLISAFLAVSGGIRWQRAKSAWQEADRQLAPLRAVKAAYNESKQADYRIRIYRQILQHISLTDPAWYSALRTIGMTIPEGCWIEDLQQKQTHSGRLEIKGYALQLALVSDFLEKLERSELFSQVRLVESGTRRIVLKDRGDNSKTVVSFLLLAELAPVREEAIP